jgi:hypothetical protein
MEIRLDTVGVTEALVRMDARIKRMSDPEPVLDAMSDRVYEATARWYDSDGAGTWPALAASTIARKTSRGSADPGRPLYDTGSLYQSATSPSGPYSFKMHPNPWEVVIGVDWALGGWQIPVVHFYGTQTAGAGNATVIPPRPIWPAHGSSDYAQMRVEMTELMMHGA